HRSGILKCAQGAALRQTRQLGPARIRKAQQLCRLVEGFARGIVPCIAQGAVDPDPRDLYELGMSARNEEGHVRKGGWLRLQERCEQMPFEVVDAHRR